MRAIKLLHTCLNLAEGSAGTRNLEKCSPGHKSCYVQQQHFRGKKLTTSLLRLYAEQNTLTEEGVMIT